ncbi:hypothetical protein BKA64DRAFT_766003 [Cadophora sp. MPI-SDFR-AT-0126]|nr:hypothetical protein BKA64DRAFT_766003 [Leotiomycetes sp. MPI-SDFR-AT-0126]
MESNSPDRGTKINLVDILESGSLLPSPIPSSLSSPTTVVSSRHVTPNDRGLKPTTEQRSTVTKRQKITTATENTTLTGSDHKALAIVRAVDQGVSVLDSLSIRYESPWTSLRSDYELNLGGICELVAILFQILEAVSYLDKQNLEHGSLSCSNILLTPQGVIKITYQETCRDITWSQPRLADVKAIGYIAIELMQKYHKDDSAISLEDFSSISFYGTMFKRNSSNGLLESQLLKHRAVRRRRALYAEKKTAIDVAELIPATRRAYELPKMIARTVVVVLLDVGTVGCRCFEDTHEFAAVLVAQLEDCGCPHLEFRQAPAFPGTGIGSHNT